MSFSVTHTVKNPPETSQPQIRHKKIFGRPNIRQKIPLTGQMAIKNRLGLILTADEVEANVSRKVYFN